MPNKITLSDVIPVLWTGLDIDPAERDRPLKRSVYTRIMKQTGTIVSPSVLSRMWETVAASKYARRSTEFADVIILDVPAMKLALYECGQAHLVRTHTPHTEHTHHTHTTQEARR